MATIDKELLKQIVNAKKPRNYAFVEGGEERILLVNKSKIGKDEEAAAQERAKNGKVTSRGKIQVEQGEDGKQKVVFFSTKVNESLVPKLRRALKQQVGLSRVVEMRPLKEDEKEQGNNENGNEGNNGNVAQGENNNGENAPKVKPRGQFETVYRKLRKNLLEEVEALKVLKPKAVAKIEQKLQEAEKGLGPEKDGDKRFKEGAKTLKKLTSTVAKLKVKPGKEQQAVSDRATYKTMRAKLVGQIHKVGELDLPLAKQCVAALVHEADPLIADNVPEPKRDYKKALKILEHTKQKLDKRELLAKKKGEKFGMPNRDAAYATFGGDSRAAKQLLAKFTEYVPQAKEIGPLQQLLDQAVEENRVFNHDRAKETLESMTGQLQTLINKYESTAKSLETTRAMLRQSENLTAPRIPQKLINTFADYLNGAEKLLKRNQLDAALSGAKDLEERIRQAHSDRRMFVDSATMIDRHLDKAFANLNEDVAEEFERRYLDTFLKFEFGDFKVAYDEITTVEAELANLLRKLPENVKPPKNQKVDGTAQAPEIQQGTSDKARRFKFKLNVEGVRRGFGFLQEKAPKSLDFFENWLADILKKEEKNFDEAERELAALVKEMNLATAIHRLVMPNEKHPPSTRPRRPVPPPPSETTQQWSQRINRGQLSVDENNMLGTGGQGSIYKLDSSDPNAPSLVMKVPPYGESRDAFLELESEAKNYELVGDHPNIIKSLGMQTVGNKKGLVLEQVKGTGFDNVTGNLRARLQKGEISHTEFWGSIQFTLGKTLEVLDYMHSKGLTHNDIKPENVMIDETTGDVKVIDLGTVKPITESPDDTSLAYRAPELPQGSSAQTDLFSTGASAYEMTEGEIFHFNQKGEKITVQMRHPFEKVVSKYGECIGDLNEDELGISQESQTNPRNEKVNEQGELDPQGTESKRKAGVSGSKSAYTEFINWLLHPDPKKRPSAKEALQHPFLRDRVLSDDQVKEMLRRNMVDPPLEQQGKEPLRKLVADGMQCMNDMARPLQESQELVLAFNLEPLDTMGMLKLRDEIDRCLENSSNAKRRIGNSARALESIVNKSVTRNSSEFFEDKAKLKNLQECLEQWTGAESNLSRCLLKLNIALSKQAPVGNSPNSEGLTPENVTQRIRSLQATRQLIADDEATNFGKALPLYEKLQSIQGYRDQVNSLKSRNEIEKSLLVKFVKASQGGSQQLSALNAAKDFQEYLKQVEQLQSKIIVDIDDITSDIEGVGQDIGLLEEDAAELLFNLESILKEVRIAGSEFEKLVRQPRNTQQEMKTFEEARMKFTKLQQDLSELRTNMKGMASDFLRRARQLGLQMGHLALGGMEDLPGRLAKLEQRLKTVMGKELN